MKFDLSVGQRLTIGFVLMLLLWAGVFLRVSALQEGSERAQTAFVQNIAPLRDKAAQLERSVFQLGIETRAYLISPNDRNGDAYRSAAASVRVAARDLLETPKDDLGAGLYRNVGPLLAAYLREADSAVHERRQGVLGVSPERALSESREAAVDALRGFAQYQSWRERAALSGMAKARASVSRDLHLGSGVALVLFLGIAYVTAQSIRKPARTLVGIAHEVERGFWRPAVALARAGRDGGAASGPVRDEMAELGRALGTAAAALEAREQRLHADAQVAAAAASSLDKRDLADQALMSIAEYVHAGAGVIYIRTGDTLVPIATYATEMIEAVRVGDGIAGQAAKSGRAILVTDLVADASFTLKFGFAELAPANVCAVPLCFGAEVIGVLLLGIPRTMLEADHGFVRSAAAQLAIGLHNAVTHEEVQRLLAELRLMNQRLEAQDEQIRAASDGIVSWDEASERALAARTPRDVQRG